MKRSRSLFWLVWLYLLVIFPAHAVTNIFPGLIFHEGPEVLKGQLVFLAGAGLPGATSEAKLSGVFTFDLQKGRLQRLTDSPMGLLIASRNGSVFCVLHGTERLTGE